MGASSPSRSASQPACSPRAGDGMADESPLKHRGRPLVPILRVYYDNVACCGRVLADLDPPPEMAALRRIEAAHHAGIVKRVTSRESHREQARTQDLKKRATLEAAQGQ